MPKEPALGRLALEGVRWVIPATFGADERIRAVPFDAIEIDLAQIWG